MEVMVYIYIHPELKTLLLPFQDRKSSRAASEGISRVHGGAKGSMSEYHIAV